MVKVMRQSSGSEPPEHNFEKWFKRASPLLQKALWAKFHLDVNRVPMADIDVAVQEACALVFVQWEELSRPSMNPTGFAYRVACRHLTGLLKREGRGQELRERWIADRRDEADLIPDFEPGLAEELEKRLSEIERTVLVVRMSGSSYQEIEQALGLNEDGLKDGPARRIYHRAHKKIFGQWSEISEEDHKDDSQDEEKDSEND